MTPWRRPSFWLATILAVVASVVCASVAISARPGYESSLVLTPVLALVCGLMAVSEVNRARKLSEGPTLGQLLARTLVTTLMVVATSLLVLVVAGALRGFCDPVQGFAMFAVLPLSSAVISTILALLVALAVPGRRLIWVAWPIVLLASLAWDIALVYTTPQVFVFDHLLGWFAGPLYDEDVALGATHGWFRLISVARVAPLVLLGMALHDSMSVKLSLARLRNSRVALTGVVAVSIFATTLLTEPNLGLRTSTGAMQRALGDVTRTEHLVIYHPASLDETEKKMLAADAEMRWSRLREFFGDEPDETLTVYMFESARQMRRLTGTGPTSVAKPWLGATTVVYSSPPHPTLEHELSHLFSAKWARGPLKTPGAAWGLLADPMILEGTAVAATWKGDPLDPHTRSAAILEAGVIEDPSALMGVGFFTHAGGVSYLMSGSFVRHLWEHHGAEDIRSWYSGSSFEQAFGTSMQEALDTWQEDLEKREVPEVWVEATRLQFSQPSIFARPCPHQVARILVSAGRKRSLGDIDAASSQLERACTIAPADDQLKLGRLKLAVLGDRRDLAAKLLDDLSRSPLAEGPLAARLAEREGDLAWIDGDSDRAGERYAKAHGLTPYDNGRRLLAVKGWASTWPETTEWLRDYLLGRLQTGDDLPAGIVEQLTKLVMDHPHQPEIHYLLGRALMNVGRYEDAAMSMASARESQMCDPLLDGEALRQMASAHLWAGKPDDALDAIAALKDLPPPSSALAYRADEIGQLAEAMK